MATLLPGQRLTTEIDGVPVWVYRLSAAQIERASSNASPLRVFVPMFVWEHRLTGWRGPVPVREVDAIRRESVHAEVRGREDLMFEDATFHSRYFDFEGRVMNYAALDQGLPVSVSDMLTPHFIQLDANTLRVSTKGVIAQIHSRQS